MSVFSEALDSAQGVDLAFDNYRQDLYLGGKRSSTTKACAKRSSAQMASPALSRRTI